MNWLNSLIRKPPPPAPARATPKRAAAPKAPVVDTGPLRAALAGSLESAERARQEAALGRALGAALQSPLADDAPGVWIAAVSHGADKSIALAWLEQLSGDDVLAEIAANGRYAEVRLAAAQRIEGSAALESVARASKNKDKGVYRHCADLLRARRDGQERLHQAAQIAAGLRHLLERAPLSVSHLLDLERAWKALAGSAPHHDGATPSATGPVAADAAAAPDALQECQALLAQANARILEEAEAQRAVHALASGHDELAALIAAAATPEAALLADWRQRRDSLAQALQALPAWLGATGTAQAIAAGLQSQAERLAAWAVDQERMAALETFFAAQSAAAAPDADSACQWEALTKPEDPRLRNQVNARWQALQAPPASAAPQIAAPPERPAMPAAPPPAPAEAGPALAPAELDTLRGQLEQLEQSLEAGQLAQADAAAKLVKATLGHHGLEGRLDARLQRALARLGDLRGWAQWGATKKREDLIEAAQQLRSTVAAGTHAVEHLAVAIPALREEWKRLNAQGPAAKGQWESFDRALESAYVPVAAHHARGGRAPQPGARTARRAARAMGSRAGRHRLGPPRSGRHRRAARGHAGAMARRPARGLSRRTPAAHTLRRTGARARPAGRRGTCRRDPAPRRPDHRRGSACRRERPSRGQHASQGTAGTLAHRGRPHAPAPRRGTKAVAALPCRLRRGVCPP